MSQENPFGQFMPATEEEVDPNNPFGVFMPATKKKPNEPQVAQPATFLDRLGTIFGGITAPDTELAKPETEEGVFEAVKDLPASTVRAVKGNAQYDLPAIQETEQWNQSMDWKEKAKSIYSSGNAVDQKFLDNNPNIDVRLDEAGNRIAYDIDTQEDIGYFEQSGIGKTDVVEAVSNIGVDAIPVAIVGAVNKFRQMGGIGRAASTSAGEAAVQSFREFSDLDEDEFSVLNVGISAVAPWAAEVINYAKRGVSAAQSKYFTGQGKKYAQDNGMDWRNMKDETLEAFGMNQHGKLKHKLTDEAIIAAKEHNITQTVGEATRDPRQLAREESLIAAPTSGRNTVAEARLQGEKDMERLKQERFQAAGAGRPESRTGDELAQNIQDESARVKAGADADQARVKADVEAVPSDKYRANLILPPWKKRLEATRKKFDLDAEDYAPETDPKKFARSTANRFMTRITDDMDKAVGRRQGALKGTMNRQMDLADVPKSQRMMVEKHLQDAWDAGGTKEAREDALFQLNKRMGLNKSESQAMIANVMDVQRTVPPEKMDFDGIQRTYRELNDAIGSADGADLAALRDMRTSYEGFMQGEFKDYMQEAGGDEALQALSSITQANKSWKNYRQTFERNFGSDQIGEVIRKMRDGELTGRKAIDTIVGASNIKMDSADLKRLIDASGADSTTRDLIKESVLRRVWGDPKTGLAELTADQTFKRYHQLIHGNLSDLGKAYYPKGSKARADAELVMKTMDHMRKKDMSLKESTEIFNTLYSRVNMGDLRMVIGMDQTLGKLYRQRLRKAAIDPFDVNGDMNIVPYATLIAAENARKGQER